MSDADSADADRPAAGPGSDPAGSVPGARRLNVLFILSDQHNPEYSGCYGHRLTRTPNIDALAATGTRCASAYALSPICSSTRAAMITGRYVHETGVWDNVFGYTGTPRSFGHHLAESGVRLATIGKLDFVPGCPHGIEETHLAVHRENLDITSLYREEPILARYDLLAKHLATGPSDDLSAFAADATVAARAVTWLQQDRRRDARPWVLAVHFNDLHRPWRPPRALWEHHSAQLRDLPLDARFGEPLERLHPFHRDFTRHHLGEVLDAEQTRRAIAGYQGAVEVLDGHVGQVLQALREQGLEDDTLIIYAADHGGTVGEHRNFDHGAMYDGSIRIPLLLSGPGVRRAAVLDEVVSAIDIWPTVCEALGVARAPFVRGHSLLGALRGVPGATLPDRALCEYHGAGYNGSLFAWRRGAHKLIECVGERPMLFDLERDPLELHDRVGAEGAHGEAARTLRTLREELAEICSPAAVDARAKADQRARRAELAADGRLYEALWKRGYERQEAPLQHRPDYLAALGIGA